MLLPVVVARATHQDGGAEILELLLTSSSRAGKSPAAPSQQEVDNMARYVTIARSSQLTGYTEDAIRTKIRDGVWAEGEVWRRAPDGRVLVDLQGYERWVEGAGSRSYAEELARLTSAGRSSAKSRTGGS